MTESMISFAQNGEDVLLRRLFPDRSTGFYLDVGANDPVHWSVTKHFYESGWRGVNVEPGPIQASLLADRPRDVNLRMAVSDHEGTQTFYEFPLYPGSSTCSREEAECHRVEHGFEYVEREVQVTTLAAICRQHVTEPIDFLSIDVEGHERQVIQGGDWHNYRPIAIVIEATRPNCTIPTHDQWEPLLLAAHYRFATFDGLNRYYLREENAHQIPLLQVPVNVHDRFVTHDFIEMRRRAQEFEGQSLRFQHESWERSLKIKNLEGDVEYLKWCLSPFEDLGPTALAITRRVQRILDRYPRFTSVLLRIAKRAA